MSRLAAGTGKQILTFNDVDLHVEAPRGNYIEEVCTCDSNLMLDIIHDVRSSI